MSFIDPDGRSGEPVFDKDKGTITINMNYNFYGNSSSLNSETVNNAANYLQTELNRNGSTAIGPDGNSYPVVFNVTALVVSNEDAATMLENNVGENFDPAQNFVRLEDGDFSARNSTQPNLGFNSEGVQEGRMMTGLGGDNSMMMSSKHLTTTTWIHEATAHGLTGRGRSSHISDWSANPGGNIPSIRTHRFTRGIPSNLQSPNGQLDVSKRQVLSQDKPINVNWNNRARVGGATNTFFNADTSQKTF